MINFDSLTLKLFSEENKNFFTGGRIQKIQQPERNELVFSIRNSGETRKLYINFNPAFYHMCFMSKENEQKRNIIIPKTAPMFCMLLRKYIQNAEIINVKVPQYERIFEIYFKYFNELNEPSQLCLAIELTGRYCNVILFRDDTNVIVGCAHNVSASKSGKRELRGLLPYVYPPKQKKKNLIKVSFEEFCQDFSDENTAEFLVSNYYYLTMPIAEDIIRTAGNSKKKIYKNLIEFLSQKHFTPYIYNDYSKFTFINSENMHAQKSVNEMIDNYFGFHQSEAIKNRLKTEILNNIKLHLIKLNSLKQKQIEQMNRAEKGLDYKKTADIIAANIYLLKQGMKTVRLRDFDGNETEIELDENKTPRENANRYYLMYKKAKSAFKHTSDLTEETNSRIFYLEEKKHFAEQSDNIQELKIMRDKITADKAQPEKSGEKAESIEYKGFKIYIGKNQKQNDYILSKLSSSEDIWFHPLNAAGAHVLIKLNNSKEEITSDVILKAAKITKYYSNQKNNSKTSIIYTKRKYVKKANNKQAFVTYKNETEIVV